MELELELDGLIGGLIPVVLGVYERTLYCRLHGCDFCVFYEYGRIDGAVSEIGRTKVVLETSCKSRLKYKDVLSVIGGQIWSYVR